MASWRLAQLPLQTPGTPIYSGSQAPGNSAVSRTNDRRPAAQLAILPGFTRYNILSSPRADDGDDAVSQCARATSQVTRGCWRRSVLRTIVTAVKHSADLESFRAPRSPPA